MQRLRLPRRGALDPHHVAQLDEDHPADSRDAGGARRRPRDLPEGHGSYRRKLCCNWYRRSEGGKTWSYASQWRSLGLKKTVHRHPMMHLDRRSFVAAAGSLFAPRLAQAAKMQKLAILMGVDASDKDAQNRVSILRNELSRLGWTEGNNLESRLVWSSGRADNAVRLAQELVAWTPNVILAQNTISAQACFDHAKGIPVVFVSVFDAIGSGFVKSLAVPGTHMTGFINHSYQLAAKWIEFARALSPRSHRMHLVWSPRTLPVGERFYQSAFAEAARAFGYEPVAWPLESADELRSLIDGLRSETDNLAVMADPFTTVNRQTIIARVADNRIVTVYPWLYFVKDGGLLSYGPDQNDMFKRSAAYLDRILRSQPVSNLPVQAPVAFDLGLNLTTARAMGIEVPPLLLAHATQIVE